MRINWQNIGALICSRSYVLVRRHSPNVHRLPQRTKKTKQKQNKKKNRQSFSELFGAIIMRVIRFQCGIVACLFRIIRHLYARTDRKFFLFFSFFCTRNENGRKNRSRNKIQEEKQRKKRTTELSFVISSRRAQTTLKKGTKKKRNNNADEEKERKEVFFCFEFLHFSFCRSLLGLSSTVSCFCSNSYSFNMLKYRHEKAFDLILSVGVFARLTHLTMTTTTSTTPPRKRRTSRKRKKKICDFRCNFLLLCVSWSVVLFIP